MYLRPVIVALLVFAVPAQANAATSIPPSGTGIANNTAVSLDCAPGHQAAWALNQYDVKQTDSTAPYTLTLTPATMPSGWVDVTFYCLRTGGAYSFGSRSYFVTVGFRQLIAPANGSEVFVGSTLQFACTDSATSASWYTNIMDVETDFSVPYAFTLRASKLKLGENWIAMVCQRNGQASTSYVKVYYWGRAMPARPPKGTVPVYAVA